MVAEATATMARHEARARMAPPARSNWRNWMRRPDRPRAPRRVLASLGLLVLAAIAALCLSQCKMVDERLTGLSALTAKQSAGSCISNCAQQYNDSVRVEVQLHLTNVAACNQSITCLENEEARHEAAIARIQLGRMTCVQNCHHQGGGDGGR
jgi:hypothetical protein